jgi:hypothetical protein
LDTFPLYEKTAEYREQMEDTFAKKGRNRLAIVLKPVSITLT